MSLPNLSQAFDNMAQLADPLGIDPIGGGLHRMVANGVRTATATQPGGQDYDPSKREPGNPKNSLDLHADYLDEQRPRAPGTPKPEEARLTAFAQLTQNLRRQRSMSTMFGGQSLLGDADTSAPELTGT